MRKDQKIKALFVTGDLPPLYSGRTKNDLFLIGKCLKNNIDIDVLAAVYPNIIYDEIIDPVKLIRIETKQELYRFVFPLKTLMILIKNKYKVIRFRGYSFEYALITFFTKKFYPKCKIIIQPAKYGGDDPQSILNRKSGFGYNQSKIFLTKNPVARNIYFPVSQENKNRLRNKLHIPVGSIIFITVGIFHQRKNQALITEAFIEALKTVGKNMYLLHIGPTHNDLIRMKENPKTINFAKTEEQRVKNLIRNNNVSKNVEVIGKVDNPEEYYKASDILIHMSLSEGEANVVNEAMACGIPCILPNSPLYSDQSPGNCSYKINSIDVHNLSKSIKLLSENNKLRKSLGENSAEFVRLNRDPKIVAKQYIKKIKSLFDAP